MRFIKPIGDYFLAEKAPAAILGANPLCEFRLWDFRVAPRRG
jgi:hypothetical protein